MREVDLCIYFIIGQMDKIIWHHIQIVMPIQELYITLHIKKKTMVKVISSRLIYGKCERLITSLII